MTNEYTSMLQSVNKAIKSILLWCFLLLITGVIAQAQTGPAGVGNQSDGIGGQPRNVLWLDASSLELANGAAVSSWTDQSGNGNNANQPTAAQRPSLLLGGNGNVTLPIVRFDNTGDNNVKDFLQFDGSYLEQSDYHVIVVAARRSTGRQYWIGGENSGTDNNLHAGWDDNRFTHRHWGADYTRDMVTGSEGTGINSFGIFALSLEAGLSNDRKKVSQNGQLLGTDNNSNRINNGQYGNAFVARYGDNSYYDIDVAEYLVFSEALNQAQQIIVENYLSSKYGISLLTNDVYAGEVNGFSHEVVGIGRQAGFSHAEGGSGGFALRNEQPGHVLRR